MRKNLLFLAVIVSFFFLCSKKSIAQADTLVKVNFTSYEKAWPSFVGWVNVDPCENLKGTEWGVPVNLPGEIRLDIDHNGTNFCGWMVEWDETIYPSGIGDTYGDFNDQTPVILKLSGLDPDKNYEFIFFCSRANDIQGGRKTSITINDVKKSVEAYGNKDELIIFSNVKSDEDGLLEIYVLNEDFPDYGHLNTMIIVETQFVSSAPTVSTSIASSISSDSAVLGGNVTADGGAEVTDRGIVYSDTDETPTIEEAATKVTIGSGTGDFCDTIVSLVAGHTYYYNAYAINSAGTGYGTASSFATKSAPEQITPGDTLVKVNFTSYEMSWPSFEGWVNVDPCENLKGTVWGVPVDLPGGIRLDIDHNGTNFCGWMVEWDETIYPSGIGDTYGDFNDQTPVILKLSGLDPDKRYIFTFFSSRGNDIQGGRKTSITINDVKKSVEAYGNKDELIIFSNVKSDEDGLLEIYVLNEDFPDYGHLNTMIIIEDLTVTASLITEASLKVYSAYGQIWIDGEMDSSTKAQLFNMNGQIMGTYDLQHGNRNSIPTAGLIPGIYLIRLREGYNFRSFKVMVH